MSIDVTVETSTIKVEIAEDDITVKVSAGLRGPVGFEDKGTYSGSTIYYHTNVVNYNNALYIGLPAIGGTGIVGELPTNTIYWSQLLTSTGPFAAIATQGQAEAGTDNTTGMTPLRTLQSIQENAAFRALTTKNADYTLLATDATVLVGASSVDITITLPAAGTVTNGVYDIKKTDASGYDIIIDGDGTETIDGELTFTLLFQYESITVQSDGSNWYIL